ncbi:MAG: biopolymer transporter ExbD [Terracidiphilus sp.]|jgi:biopolymer transport protein ExbD
MAMTTGSGRGYSSEINVTPMIDILLVLLIIFMVIVPVTPKGLAALAPHPAKGTPPDPGRAIVVQLLHNPGEAPAYRINETNYAKSDLLSKLTAIYANRAERVMFVKADDGIEFRYVAEVIDIGRAANVDHIGLMTPKVTAGE